MMKVFSGMVGGDLPVFEGRGFVVPIFGILGLDRW